MRIRAKLGWDVAPLVGIVGRLEEWKGQKIFLRAAALVATSHPDARFLVVGGALLGWEGDYPLRLQRLAKELGIDERVYFAGHQDDVYPWFDAMDVVVHASSAEPFGLVIVEAMALGKALVASDSGGPAEIVEQGTSGLLVGHGDHAAMAKAVADLLSDPARRARMGRAACERAAQFDESVTAERFSHLLAEIAA